MSKLGKAFVACAAMALMAAPAYAIQADFTGFFQARAFTYDNLNGNDDVDDNARGVDQRFRLWNTTALHENVKAVFAIEVDNVWGEGVGRVGADQTGAIEIKHLYLDFNIPTANTNVKAGAKYEKLGGGFIKGDDSTGLSVRYTPAKDMSFLLSWTKMREGAVTDDRADADYYHLQYDGTFGGWKVSPFVGYMDGMPTGLGLVGFDNQFEAWFFGAEASGKIGPIGLSATAIVNTWDNDVNVNLDPNVPGDTGVDDGMGYALAVKATYPMGPTTFTAEGAIYGDDEAGKFISVRGYNNYAEIITGGRFDGRSAMNGSSAVGGTRNDYSMNHLYAKLGASHKLSDTQTVSAFYIYAEQAEDTFGAKKAKFGHEIDAYYDHAIVKGVTFTVGGGYLIADDDFGAGDDAWKVGTAITYTF